MSTLKKYKKGFSLIETIICIVVIAAFSLLVLKLNQSIKFNQETATMKYNLLNHYYNTLQIIKSDPEFYLTIGNYYNKEEDIVYELIQADDKRYYLSLYFDKYGYLTNNANAAYKIYFYILVNDYSNYCNYYYNIKLTKANTVLEETIYSGGSLYVSKCKE